MYAQKNDIFAIHLFHEEGIDLKANEPGSNYVLSKSEDARDDDQDQVPPQKKKSGSVATPHSLTCAHQPHHHPRHNQLHLIQQLEGSRYIVSKRSTNALV